MAIEFHCPVCDATVRVGDDAAGKVGRCPKCQNKVRIPEIGPAPTPLPPLDAADNFQKADQGLAGPNQEKSLADTDDFVLPPTPQTPPEPAAPIPDFTQPSTPKPTPVSDDGIPLIQTAPEKPVASSYRKRKKKGPNWGAILPPFLFGSVLVIAFIGYRIWTGPTYEGELVGQRMDPDAVIVTELRGPAVDAPPAIFKEIVQELRESPSAIRSNLVRINLIGQDNSIKFMLRPGLEADFIQVPLGEMRDVAYYYREHLDELEGVRQKEARQAMERLVKNRGPEGELPNLADFRYELVFNTFVKGLGRQVEAVVDNVRYPCVLEESDLTLGFLVPIGTTSFIIRERMDVDSEFFPAHFEVQVKVPPQDAKIEHAVETVELDESDIETRAESEEKMSPDSDEAPMDGNEQPQE